LDERFRSREDWDLLLRLAQRGVIFDYLPQFLAYYRVHKGNKSSRLDLGEASQLAVLDKFYGQQRLPDDIVAMSQQAYATVYLNSYIAWHQAGDEQMAYRKLREAVMAWPELLSREETYYRLACADQPPGYRATSCFRDPGIAQNRIAGLLNRLQSDPDVAKSVGEGTIGHQAEAIANQVSSWFYYLDGERWPALKHLGQAIRLHPGFLMDAKVYKRAVQAVSGYEAIQHLKRLLGSTDTGEVR
jgi:tetratricopeptide (TPR) repeat protein